MKKQAAQERLFRFRPLEDSRGTEPGPSLLERELEALRDSYLFSPPFSAMNDPMEAFYEFGGDGDGIIRELYHPSGKVLNELYDQITSTVCKFGLVSFAASHEDLPMWAYYATSFAGMCLEFDPEGLQIGDLQNEVLREVLYTTQALPALNYSDVVSDHFLEKLIQRITRKRIEWAHERELRFVTGQVGRKYYVDDALKRVYLGPRIKCEHERQVCDILDRRPVEVLKGEVQGFELIFHSIKPARSLRDSERIGAGLFSQSAAIYDEDAVRSFLGAGFDKLINECQQTRLRPNLEEICQIGVSSNRPGTIYFRSKYKVRDGREFYYSSHFDSEFITAN